MTSPAEKTVLVVDDEPDVRNYLSTLLRDAGFRVCEAENGEVALEMVRESAPDFISLDLVMPKKSGHRFLYELKKNRTWAKIPVLIVTAHARDEMGRADLDDILKNHILAGPGVHLEKPVDPEGYVRCIRETLGLPSEEKESPGIRNEMEEEMRRATPEQLRKALEVLRKKDPKKGTGEE